MPRLTALLLAPALARHFSDAELFERLSHYKDFGIPQEAAHSEFATSAIADASCRLMQVPCDGTCFFGNKALSKEIIELITAQPPTTHPSNFTLTVKPALQKICTTAKSQHEFPVKDYAVADYAGAMGNWYRAICADAREPAWQGYYDPAYQAQQIAPTTALLCTIAAAVQKETQSENVLESIVHKPFTARDRICNALPFDAELTTGCDDVECLGKKVQKLTEVCGGLGEEAKLV